jgi:HD-GYP domain-containing protein (c-di-GMP phosphodiesterase class II)
MSPDLVAALVGVIEAKDAVTAAHTWRVVLYTRTLAEAYGLPHGDISRLTAAAALHDLGKIDLPDGILEKPGRLTDEEFNLVKQHPVLGYERLVRMEEDDPMLLDLVRHHHERMDGKGYPDGLKGERIPRVARWFSVIDAFDALTSIRPYRQEIGSEAARHAIFELRADAGPRYESEVVEAFADLYHTGRLAWILDYYNDSCPVPDFSRLDDPPRSVPH